MAADSMNASVPAGAWMLVRRNFLVTRKSSPESPDHRVPTTAWLGLQAGGPALAGRLVSTWRQPRPGRQPARWSLVVPSRRCRRRQCWRHGCCQGRSRRCRGRFWRIGWRRWPWSAGRVCWRGMRRRSGLSSCCRRVSGLRWCAGSWRRTPCRGRLCLHSKPGFRPPTTAPVVQVGTLGPGRHAPEGR